MIEKLKSAATLALAVGFVMGALIGGASSQILTGGAKDNEAPEETDIYEIRRLQLRERIKAYYGILDSIKRGAGITENQKPREVAENVQVWIGEEPFCRYYAPLTFTVLADDNYENLSLHWGYVKYKGDNYPHLWLTWENDRLEHPFISSLSHVAENIFPKEKLWDWASD